ncbi:uncharacterized protein LOC111181131 isoform X1 [Delphinapterus leucas]|uniref:Uncharacterized protein LOC111181131 isoform X1 n=1 Tax=Delphinapterus leucas TaxID=9749 RepID=A0A2Y9P9H8_DELLE|nr:uncharacterized protein LOC111181131 isoform X1 [Delphinapterus leucas]
MRLEMCAWQVALSGFSKSLPLALPSVACAEPVGEGWAQEIGTEPPGARVRGLRDGRNHLFQQKPSVSFPRKVQRWGLLLFLGVQLLPAGAFLYWNHHRHGCASFLCFLIQDKPEEGEGLLFLVQVSSVEIPHQDGYSNLSQIHPVDIGGPLKMVMPENVTMEQVVEKNALVGLGGQYWPPDCWAQHHMAVVVPYCGQAQHLQHLLLHLRAFLQPQPLQYAICVVNQVRKEWGGAGAREQRALRLALESQGCSCQSLS